MTGRGGRFRSALSYAILYAVSEPYAVMNGNNPQSHGLAFVPGKRLSLRERLS
jgi:hypothetical protein